jgi:hypothetical protein
VTQSGPGDTASVLQASNNDVSVVTQAGAGNSATVHQ